MLCICAPYAILRFEKLTFLKEGLLYSIVSNMKESFQ